MRRVILACLPTLFIANVSIVNTGSAAGGPACSQNERAVKGELDAICYGSVVIVNNTTHDFTAAAIVHRPSRSLGADDQWVDPKPKEGIKNSELWQNIAKGTTSSEKKEIKFRITKEWIKLKERDWWFVVFSYSDGMHEKIFASAPLNYQKQIDVAAKVVGGALQVESATKLTALLQAALAGNPATGLATLVVSGTAKAIVDPNKWQSRAGFKEKSLHPQDDYAAGDIKLIISEEKGEFRLRIATPSGSTRGETEFNEKGIDLTELYKKIYDAAKKEAGSKDNSTTK